MAGQSVFPNHVSVLFEVGAQDDLNLRVLNYTALNRLDEDARISKGHLLKLTRAASVTVEGNTPKKGVALFIDVEVCKHAVVLEAEAKAARPRLHLRENSD